MWSLWDVCTSRKEIQVVDGFLTDAEAFHHVTWLMERRAEVGHGIGKAAAGCRGFCWEFTASSALHPVTVRPVSPLHPESTDARQMHGLLSSKPQAYVGHQTILHILSKM